MFVVEKFSGLIGKCKERILENVILHGKYSKGLGHFATTVSMVQRIKRKKEKIL